MDGAWIGSIDISHKKARTSAWFTMDTAALVGAVQPGAPLYNIEHSKWWAYHFSWRRTY
ncbi:MAG: heme-binding protein [Ferruginibacter sp.]